MEILLLLIVPVLTGVLCWSIGPAAWKNRVNVLGSAVVLVVGLTVAGRVFAGGTITGWSEALYLDPLGAYILAVVVLVSFMAALYSVGYMKAELAHGVINEVKLGRYYLFYHLFVFTMLLVVVVNNLGVMWVAIEATTLASALVVGFYNQKTSLEAAWKYIILCTVGITFALFGTVLAYYSAVKSLGEVSNALNWTVLLANAGKLDPGLIKLSFLFILIGYGTKAGLAPMHTWLPDAHSQAPSPVSAVLSGVLLNCALYGIIRFHTITSAGIGPGFSARLLVIFGLISMGIAVPFIMLQRDFKRLLAYSSVEHMGIIAAGIGIGGAGLGAGAKLGIFGALLHLFNHAIAKSMMFFAAGSITQRYKSRNMGRIRGAVKTMPVTGAVFLIGSFAITGAPPFNIFISEFSIVSGSFQQGSFLVAVLFLVFISLIFAGITYHVSKMALGKRPERIVPGEENWLMVAATTLPVVLVLILGMYIPPWLAGIIEQVARVVIIRGGN